MPTPETPAAKSNVKETITSVAIAFTMAIVFRGFVIEAFLIPTGSMAPTLRGANTQYRCPDTGYSWASDVWNKDQSGTPFPFSGTMTDLSDPRHPRQFGPVEVHDPMSGALVRRDRVPTSWGDRIFVMKYLMSVFEPARFDVVVFMNPTDPSIHYIKRLIGLPGEMVALVDGDVYTRAKDGQTPPNGNPWLLPGWTIARKPERAQRAMWQPLFSSEYQPIKDTANLRRWFTSPWRGGGSSAKDWKIDGRTSYQYTGAAPTTLTWDSAARPINDTYAYNETPRWPEAHLCYPVSDVRVSVGVRPGAPNQQVAAVLETRGHQFRAEVAGTGITIRMKPLAGDESAWRTLGTGTLAHPLTPGSVTNLDVWFVDQSVRVYIEDSLVAKGDYDWSIDERLRYTLGFGAEDARQDSRSLVGTTVATQRASGGNGQKYPQPKVRLEFSGGPVDLYRVALARDIYYQPSMYPDWSSPTTAHSLAGTPALATHPSSGLALTPDQYFVCGDNSPASLDARLWDKPNPWVAQIDPTTGVVHRDLMIGKAFFVYLPSPHKRRNIPVPDFGEMRFIW